MVGNWRNRLKSSAVSTILRALGIICALAASGCSDSGDGARDQAHADHQPEVMEQGGQARDHEAAPESPAVDGDLALSISNAYIRQPAPGQGVVAGFVTFTNNSLEALILNHVSSPIASAVEVHRTQYKEGKMMMRRVNHLTIPPKGTLAFEPGGYHLMLMGVDKALEPGEEVQLTFTFQGGRKLAVSATVRPLH